MIRLTLTLTHSSTIAYTTSLLFIISPSPATLNASPYTEPFAALFTFLGMLFFVRQRWFMAAVWWTIGTSFRAQGLLLGIGFFGWQFVIGSIKRRTLVRSLISMSSSA
jgi:phosphatidylinositol glycan class V